MIMKLWALCALAGPVSALLPVIVPMSDNTNDTLLTWGPVTADISANRSAAASSWQQPVWSAKKA